MSLTENDQEKYEIMKGAYAAGLRLKQFNYCMEQYGTFIPPNTTGKPTLILDLDHTLIYPSNVPFEGYDFRIPVVKGSTRSYFYVKKRPHLQEFLKECHEMFEIVIFSAAIPEFAELCIEKIDLDQVIDYRLYRYACSNYSDQFLCKDISRLGRDLRKCIVVDDSYLNYILQPYNGVPVRKYNRASDDFYDDDNLPELLEFLIRLTRLTDVRQLLKYGKDSKIKIEYFQNNPNQYYYDCQRHFNQISSLTHHTQKQFTSIQIKRELDF